MDIKEFALRLSQLRMNVGYTASDMSESMGKSRNFLSQLENARHFPTMENFFEICTYLRITPKDFFDVGVMAPTKLNELYEMEKTLSSEQLDVLISMVKAMKKE